MIKQKRVYSSYDGMSKNHRISKWQNLPRRHIFPWRGSNVFRHTAYFFKVRALKIKHFPGFENFEIKIQIILLQYEMLECGLYHDENGYLCKSES